MKKIALALSLVGTFSFIQAESDGAFIGVGLGFGQNKVTYDVPLAISSVSQKKNQINYIGVVGYKKFFNENFGLRTYLSYEQSNNKGYGFDLGLFYN